MKTIKLLIAAILLVAAFQTNLFARGYSCSALSGGGSGALDALDITGATTPNPENLADGDWALVAAAGVPYVYFYIFDADGTDAESSPDVIRPDDYAAQGVWLLVEIPSGMLHSSLDAISNTEAFTQNRLRETVHTAEPTDEVAGDRIIADNDTWDPCSIDGTDDYEVICLVAGSPGTWKAIRNMVTGEILSASIDLTGGSIAASYTISSPQSLSVTTEDDVTVGTELTSSVVLLTGDNDTDNDTLTLQDGITDGTILTFFMAAGVDTDDNIIIDAETDSTCTGCPDSGIFTFTANGGSLTLWWSGSAWFFRGQVNGE